MGTRPAGKVKPDGDVYSRVSGTSSYEGSLLSVARELDSEETLDRLHGISFLLDNAVRIPGTNYRIGLDPIVGLLPVAGDIPGAALAAYIVVEAAYLGAPRETILRMVLNLVVDAVVGSLPVVGDVFDAVWKANARNVQLLEGHQLDPDAGAADRRFLLFATVSLLGLLLAIGASSVLLVAWMLGNLGGF